jgi:hypothetical protein
MPVLRASSLALFVVGSLEACDGDAREQVKKRVYTRVPIAVYESNGSYVMQPRTCSGALSNKG